VYSFLKGQWSASDRAVLLGYLLAFASSILFNLFDVSVFDSRINLLSWGLLAAIYRLSHHKNLEEKQLA
jgi:hypothetical protein